MEARGTSVRPETIANESFSTLRPWLQPPAAHVEFERCERLGVNTFLAAMRADHHPALPFQSVDFQRPLDWIDQPDVFYSFADIAGHFAYAVKPPRGR